MKLGVSNMTRRQTVRVWSGVDLIPKTKKNRFEKVKGLSKDTVDKL